ncbi:short-chain dehydrogenase/reductase [Desulfosarcina variabilis str. Montpellier]|uniref:SDR family NAD(P)-dependent oxidoreductase n=1 Tax=Desulfosarcina variabilis TaxID=2300 RepID=UPI003AFAB5B5
MDHAPRPFTYSLKERIGIVTGAASGIGRATALQLASMGAGLCLVDLDGKGLEHTQRAIDQQSGTPTLIMDANAADKASIDQVVADTIARFGDIHFLVNCAGILRRTAFTDMTIEEWDQVMHINLRGPFLFCKAVATEMIQRGTGVIINVASLAGRSSSILGGAHYTVSKHGMIGLSRHMARELGPQGVRVNAFCPGATLTPMTASTAPPEEIKAVEAAMPRRQWATPEEQAAVIGFLLTDAAVNITGACIDSNGGSLML